MNDDTPIAKSGLPVRARHVLINLGAHTIGDARKLKWYDIMRQPNTGTATLNAIELLLYPERAGARISAKEKRERELYEKLKAKFEP